MIAFSGNPLNRMSEKRPDAAWITGKLRDSTSRILPLWRLQVLTTGDGAVRPALVTPEIAERLADRGTTTIFLGIDGARAYFALDVSTADDAPARLAASGQFRELRGAAPLLAPGDLTMLGQARSMIDWHQRHGFCALCGFQTSIADAGYKRVCGACRTEHFPRVDPCVIMLAVNGGACLLARNKNWPPDFYSALAGFLEPGESIEEAVRRELFEEAGVRAQAVRYVGSQPWPFPSQLMIGCIAECADRSLMLDPAEIADAEWFDRERARALIDGKIEGRRGPMSVAIANYLIRAWMGE